MKLSNLSKKKFFYVFISILSLFFISSSISFAQTGQSFVRALNPFWNLIYYLFFTLLQNNTRPIFFKFLVFLLLGTTLLAFAPRILSQLKIEDDTAKKNIKVAIWIISLMMTLTMPSSILDFIFLNYGFFGFIIVLIGIPIFILKTENQQTNIMRSSSLIIAGVTILAYTANAYKYGVAISSGLADIYTTIGTLLILIGVIMFLNSGINLVGNKSKESNREPSVVSSKISKKDIDNQPDTEKKELLNDIKVLSELNIDFAKEIEKIQKESNPLLNETRKRIKLPFLNKEEDFNKKLTRIRAIELNINQAIQKIQPCIDLITKIKSSPKFDELSTLNKKTPFFGYYNIVNSFIKNFKIFISLVMDYIVFKTILIPNEQTIIKEENLADWIKKLKNIFEFINKNPDSDSLSLESRLNGLNNEISSKKNKFIGEKVRRIKSIINELEKFFIIMDQELKNFGSLTDEEKNFLEKINKYNTLQDEEKNEITNNLNKYKIAFEKGIRYLRKLTYKGINDEKKLHNLIKEIISMIPYLENEELKIENAYNLWIGWIKEIEQDILYLNKHENHLEKDLNDLNYHIDIVNFINKIPNFYQHLQNSENVCKTLIIEFEKLKRYINK